MIEGWQRSVQSLRKFSAKAKVAKRVEIDRCDLCAATLSRNHQHLIDPKTRKLVCSCDGCSVLFDGNGATQYRRIPRRVHYLSEFYVEDAVWTRLSVPIGLVFFYRSSHAQRIVALYPSPAGLTEVLLEDETWYQLAQASPAIRELREDVEALLVNRLREAREYFIAPIDRCFELAGVVRAHWKGFTGGDAVWAEVAGFMSTLKEQGT
jgi:hypothetical protein